jgi:hypothetical protein
MRAGKIKLIDMSIYKVLAAVLFLICITGKRPDIFFNYKLIIMEVILLSGLVAIMFALTKRQKRSYYQRKKRMYEKGKNV